jgi:hypothetical protein
MDLQIVDRQVRAEPGGQLVDFAVVLQGRSEGTDEAWGDVARVDCSTGYVHVDEGDKKHDSSFVPPECKTDLEAARRWALGYCWDVDERLGR